MRKKTAKQRLKGFFLFSHRWLGIISGLVVFVVAITGCIYVFEKEARETFQRKYYRVENPGTPKLAPSLLKANVEKEMPGDTVFFLRVIEAADGAVLCSMSSGKSVSVNPYTGKVIASRVIRNDFFSVVLRLHRNLLLGKVGTEIVKWNVLIFFVLCVTGLILWWPKRIKQFKQAATINFKTKNKKRFVWDLHSVLGFYGLVILVLIALTGIFWMFDSVRSGVRTLAGEVRPKEQKFKSKVTAERTFSLDSAYSLKKKEFPGAEESFLSFPDNDSTAFARITMQYPYTVFRKQNVWLFDQFNGKVLRETLYEKASTYDVINRSNYQLHTGNMPGIGIGMKIIYFLASLFAASLPITGMMVWLNRGKKKTKTLRMVPVSARSAKTKLQTKEQVAVGISS